jgi:hypothetical protein
LARTQHQGPLAKVRGFMLNVTHFDWTLNNVRFGLQLSRRLGASTSS